MMVHVRPVEPADIPQWAALRAALWAEDSAARHAAEAEQYFKVGAPGTGGLPEMVFVALDPGSAAPALLGFAEVSRRSYAEGCDSSPVGFLEGWYVVPGRRQQGVGRALVLAGERWAATLGCVEFASDALAENQLSATAHQALGFEVAAVIRCFRKNLSSSRS